MPWGSFRMDIYTFLKGLQGFQKTFFSQRTKSGGQRNEKNVSPFNPLLHQVMQQKSSFLSPKFLPFFIALLNKENMWTYNFRRDLRHVLSPKLFNKTSIFRISAFFKLNLTDQDKFAVWLSALSLAYNLHILLTNTFF